MVAITATNSTTPLMEASLVKSRLDAAKRETAQAEANVHSLRAQTDAAESELEKTQAKVRSLASRANQVDPTYTSKIATSQSAVPLATQERLVDINSSNSLKTSLFSAPTMNTWGQTTGRIVNVSA
jgi:hypothetical protein